jgi:hypothetical protein
LFVSGLRFCGYKLQKDREQKIQADKWMMSKHEMESYIDVLAPRILAVWDIEKEPEWCEGRITFQKDVSPTSHDKVQEWLTNVQNKEKHSGLSEEEPSVLSTLHLSEQDTRSKKSKYSMTTQSVTPRKDLYKMTNCGFQDVFTPSKTNFFTSTPSVARNIEGPTQDTFKILDFKVNDPIIQDTSVSQTQATRDGLTSVRCTVKESPELLQYEDSMVLTQRSSNIKKKDIKIHKNNAFVAGF